MPGEPDPVHSPTADPAAARREGESAGATARPPAGLDWVAQLPSAAAPGYVYLAGACRGTAVGGGGTTMPEAVARLAGETAEVLATALPPQPSDAPGDPGLDALFADAPPRRIRAMNLAAGTALGLPAAAAFPAEPRHADAPPVSLGLAAGPDPEAARRSALLEVIERDAAARWWQGETRPRTLAPDAALTATLAGLRDGAALARTTAFLALPSMTGVPVACALSRDPDGRGLACGLKAAPDMATAAAGALLELCQMEIALELARLRLARGARTEGDAGVLARAALDPDAFPAFAARLPLAADPAPDTLDGLVARLADLGLPVIAADLPHPGGPLAVAKVVVPGLRPLPGPGPTRGDAPGATAPLL